MRRENLKKKFLISFSFFGVGFWAFVLLFVVVVEFFCGVGVAGGYWGGWNLTKEVGTLKKKKKKKEKRSRGGARRRRRGRKTPRSRWKRLETTPVVFVFRWLLVNFYISSDSSTWATLGQRWRRRRRRRLVAEIEHHLRHWFHFSVISARWFSLTLSLICNLSDRVPFFFFWGIFMEPNREMWPVPVTNRGPSCISVLVCYWKSTASWNRQRHVSKTRGHLR